MVATPRSNARPWPCIALGAALDRLTCRGEDVNGSQRQMMARPTSQSLEQGDRFAPTNLLQRSNHDSSLTRLNMLLDEVEHPLPLMRIGVGAREMHTRLHPQPPFPPLSTCEEAKLIDQIDAGNLGVARLEQKLLKVGRKLSRIVPSDQSHTLSPGESVWTSRTDGLNFATRVSHKKYFLSTPCHRNRRYILANLYYFLAKYFLPLSSGGKYS